MPRLVTGLFYSREEAERAIESLMSAGIPSADIYLEQEVDPTAEIGRKGGEVSRLEQERRFAGLETGMINGLAMGFLGGLGVGIIGSGVGDMLQSQGEQFSSLITNPFVTSLSGAVIGLTAGGLIGWVIDTTLSRLGAGPAPPMEETLVTVRADEGKLDQIYATLFRSRARHLHIAEQSAAG
jgi:hypothetical protein